MTALRFEPNRRGVQELAAAAQMARGMEDIASEVADEMERTAPASIREHGSFGTRSNKEGGVQQGEAWVKSSFWHWAEFGTAGPDFRTARPFIRPSAQKVLSKYRGRFRAE